MTIKPTCLEALSLDTDRSGTEYLLNPGHDSVWITINNISVYLCRNDEGVTVNLYPVEEEDSDSLATIWLTFAEACVEDKVNH